MGITRTLSLTYARNEAADENYAGETQYEMTTHLVRLRCKRRARTTPRRDKTKLREVASQEFPRLLYLRNGISAASNRATDVPVHTLLRNAALPCRHRRRYHV